MKGPYERLKYDLRRVWECPVCHHRERTGGDMTGCLCRCQRKLPAAGVVWMRLVEDGVRRVLPAPSATPSLASDVESPSDVESSSDIESAVAGRQAAESVSPQDSPPE